MRNRKHYITYSFTKIYPNLSVLHDSQNYKKVLSVIDPSRDIKLLRECFHGFKPLDMTDSDLRDIEMTIQRLEIRAEFLEALQLRRSRYQDRASDFVRSGRIQDAVRELRELALLCRKRLASFFRPLERADVLVRDWFRLLWSSCHDVFQHQACTCFPVVFTTDPRSPVVSCSPEGEGAVGAGVGVGK